jgi:hypothetical protein
MASVRINYGEQLLFTLLSERAIIDDQPFAGGHAPVSEPSCDL